VRWVFFGNPFIPTRLARDEILGPLFWKLYPEVAQLIPTKYPDREITLAIVVVVLKREAFESNLESIFWTIPGGETLFHNESPSSCKPPPLKSESIHILRTKGKPEAIHGQLPA